MAITNAQQYQQILQKMRDKKAFGGLMGIDGRKAYVGGSYGGNTGGSTGQGPGEGTAGSSTGNGPVTSGRKFSPGWRRCPVPDGICGQDDGG